MIWIVIALLVVIFALLVWNQKLRDSKEKHYVALVEASIEALDMQDQINLLKTKLFEADHNYAMLDIGAQEIQENYEQEFLSLNEIIAGLGKSQEMQRNQIDELSVIVAAHFGTCLPDVLAMGFFEGYNEDLYEETPVFDAFVLENA